MQHRAEQCTNMLMEVGEWRGKIGGECRVLFRGFKAKEKRMRYYLDTEFDGHGGSLLSIALVPEAGNGLYIRTTGVAFDPWVRKNVEPWLHVSGADVICADFCLFDVGPALKEFIGPDAEPVIIADSPVDIARFCAAISTGPDGGWAEVHYPRMTFEVHNVECYPTTLPNAIQHNAWWDAMALREKLSSRGDTK